MSKISRKKQNVISAIVIVAGTVLSLLFFGPSRSHSQTDPMEESLKPATEVAVLTLGENGTQTAILKKSATFSSAQSAQVSAEYAGKITQVSFEVGDYVSEGQTLAVFDQSRNENSAKISLESAGTTLDFALNTLKKTKLLLKEGEELARNARKIAEIQLDQAKDGGDDDEKDLAERSLKNAKDLEDQAEENSKLQTLAAEQQVNQSRTGLEQSRIVFDNTIIKAPISGLIVSKSVGDDQSVGFGDVVAEIVGAGKLEAIVSLNEDQINRIQIGDEVNIAFSEKEALGEVVAFSPIANPNNNRFDVTIKSLETLSAEANKTARVEMKLRLNSEKTNNFFVPLSAVSIGQQSNIVFVEREGSAKTVEVEIGQNIGQQVEIIGGLEDGDRLIIENNRGLRNGERVEIKS